MTKVEPQFTAWFRRFGWCLVHHPRLLKNLNWLQSELDYANYNNCQRFSPFWPFLFGIYRQNANTPSKIRYKMLIPVWIIWKSTWMLKIFVEFGLLSFFFWIFILVEVILWAVCPLKFSITTLNNDRAERIEGGAW